MKRSTAKSDLETRVAALEHAVFGSKPKRKTRAAAKETFSGATGGLRLLVSNGYFNQRRRFSEIEKELNKQGYHYSKQAIQTPLNRMSRPSGPLVGLKEQGHKAYAKRK
jgi:hypothetical protein